MENEKQSIASSGLPEQSLNGSTADNGETRSATSKCTHCHRIFSHSEEHDGCESCGGLAHYDCLFPDDYLSDDEKGHLFCLSCRKFPNG